MSLRIAIIGAGWYGCHIGLSFASLGFKVSVFERQHRAMHEASGNNQFRLHLGFHYARHQLTRQQSRDGFQRFIERYPDLSAPVERNIYAVPRGSSLIDFSTYKLIMASTGIDFQEIHGDYAPLVDIEGAMLTSERVLLIAQARQYFVDHLGSDLHLGHEVRNIDERGKHVAVDGEIYDYIIDATWGRMRPPPIDIIFEPTILLYYEAVNPHPAVTLVDGPLCSVYPTEDSRIFTLSSVLHTPMGQYPDWAAGYGRSKDVTSEVVRQKRTLMEEQIVQNLPDFRDAFKFVGVQISMKTKPVGNFDDRSCQVFRNGRCFSVMSGKVDTIFVASERILAMLAAEHAVGRAFAQPSLRNDILVPTE